jgi:beta-N-acetylhexosaminidase
MTRRFFALLLMLTTFTFPSPAQKSAPAAMKPFPRQPSKEALKWAEAQLKKMSADEKIGQLISIGYNAKFLNQDSAEFRELRRQVTENHVGGVILFRGPVYESAVLVNRLQALAKWPLLVSADLEAGAGMRFDDTVNFPWNMALAAAGDPELARRQGVITAREARALGVQQLYAPVVDVNNNADNPVINVRSYGEDPADVGRFAAAFIEGAQSAGAMATIKHFPGHGDTAVDSHRGLPIINLDRKRLDAVELAPFRAGIRAGVSSVMVAHISLPQIDPTEAKPLKNAIAPVDAEAGTEIVTEKATIPATLSPVVNTQILRQELKFDGLIVTDSLAMSGLTLYFQQDEAAVRALLAGADQLLKPADTDAAVRGLRAALKSGRLTMERVEQSARKILAAKYDLGLARQRLADINEIDRVVGSPESVKLANDIASRAVTLVRDDAKLLPLPPDKRIFILGVTNGDDRLFIARPFLETLRAAGRRFDVAVLDERATPAEINAARLRAQRADVVVAALYGRVRSGAVNSVGLPEAGAALLRETIQRKTPVVGISFGNPYLLQAFPDLTAYVVAYGDMPSLQTATSRALTGQAAFTGRLPISLPGLYPRGTGIQSQK